MRKCMLHVSNAKCGAMNKQFTSRVCSAIPSAERLGDGSDAASLHGEPRPNDHRLVYGSNSRFFLTTAHA